MAPADFILTLDRPRLIRLNDGALDRFKQLSGVDFFAADISPTTSLDQPLRVFALLVIAMAMEVDPHVDVSAMLGAITLGLMLEFLAQLRRIDRPAITGPN